METDLSDALRDNGWNFRMLADAIGVNRSTVTRWGQKRIPAERVIEVESITGIPRAALRPDLYAENRDGD